jgi:tetratricopeptide (TPR) repeat protein
MNIHKRFTIVAVLVLLSGIQGATTLASAEPLQSIQTRWAEINYLLPEEQRRDAFAELAAIVDLSVADAPEDARLLTWKGIVYSTWAGTGGLRALGRAKEARRALERALEIDETVLDGSAHVSLGILLHEVPGWPVGFGDEGSARKHLERGLELNPDGIDANYFLGKWLLDRKHLAEAGVRLRHALEAPDREGRPIADQGRREEIRAALEQLDQRLASN